jgi:MFS family permease
LSPLTNRSGWRQAFTFLWLGSAASQLGSMTAAVAGPLLALALTKSAVFAGWVAAASTLPGVLLQIPAGFVIDRTRDKRRLMTVSQVIRLCSALTFLLGLLFSGKPHIFLILAVVVDNVCTTFYSLAEIIVIRDLVPEEERNSATSKDEVRGHISQVIGRSIGGFFFGLHKTLPYFFDAFMSVLTIFFLRSLGRGSDPGRTKNTACGESDGPDRELPSGWRIVWRDLQLRRIIFVCAVANFLLQVTILLLLVWAKEQHYSSSQIGILLASSGLFGVIGSIVTQKWFTPKSEQVTRQTLLAFWAWVFLMMCVWQSRTPAAGLLFWGMFSAVGAYINIILRCHQTTRVPQELLGRATSICKFVTTGATPLGALVAGPAIHWWNQQEIMLTTTLAMTAVVALASVGPVHRLLRTSNVVRRPSDRRIPSKLIETDFPPSLSPSYHSLQHSLSVHPGQNRSKDL